MMSLGDSLPDIPPVISFGTDTNIYLFNYFATIPKLFVSYMYLHCFFYWMDSVVFSSVYPVATHEVSHLVTSIYIGTHVCICVYLLCIYVCVHTCISSLYSCVTIHIFGFSH